MPESAINNPDPCSPDAIEGYISLVEGRVHRLYWWYFLLTIFGLITIEMYRYHKITDKQFFGIIKAIHVGHIGTSLMLLFPLAL